MINESYTESTGIFILAQPDNSGIMSRYSSTNKQKTSQRCQAHKGTVRQKGWSHQKTSSFLSPSLFFLPFYHHLKNLSMCLGLPLYLCQPLIRECKQQIQKDFCCVGVQVSLKRHQFKSTPFSKGLDSSALQQLKRKCKTH